MKIKISYCLPCKYEPQTKALIEEIKHSFPDEKIEFEIVEVDGANFNVEIDDQRLFSKKQAQRWPVYREIPERILEVLTKQRKAQQTKI